MLTIPVSIPQESGEGWSKVCVGQQYATSSEKLANYFQWKNVGIELRC